MDKTDQSLLGTGLFCWGLVCVAGDWFTFTRDWLILHWTGSEITCATVPDSVEIFYNLTAVREL